MLARSQPLRLQQPFYQRRHQSRVVLLLHPPLSPFQFSIHLLRVQLIPLHFLAPSTRLPYRRHFLWSPSPPLAMCWHPNENQNKSKTQISYTCIFFWRRLHLCTLPTVPSNFVRFTTVGFMRFGYFFVCFRAHTSFLLGFAFVYACLWGHWACTRCLTRTHWKLDTSNIQTQRRHVYTHKRMVAGEKTDLSRAIFVALNLHMKHI